MRKITVVILAIAALAACTSIDCPVQSLVTTNYTLKKANGTTDTLNTDTIWVVAQRADRTDTMVLNSQYDICTGFSVDCSAAYFHKITAVSTTHHVIDSIVVNYADVNYDNKQEHFYIYFKKTGR